MKRYLKKIFKETGARHDLRYLILGAVIGAIAALTSIAFREGIHYWSGVVKDSPSFVELGYLNIVLLFLIPIVIGILVNVITEKYAKEASGHGVPEIMLAVATKRGLISVRTTIVKFFTSILSIGAGFSVGREGPSALLGSGVGSFFGSYLGLGIGHMKMIVGCGAAAGIAATFNAPLAGTTFALELIVGSYNVRNISSIFMASMIATVISHEYYGNTHELFSKLELGLHSPWQILAYIVLGIVCAGVGSFFVKFLYYSEEKIDSLNIGPVTKGIFGGLALGLCLYISYDMAGTQTWHAIDSNVQLSELDRNAVVLLFVFAGLKILATSLSVGFGASGGIFAPTLLIGSYVGASFGGIYNRVFNGEYSPDVGFTLVAMGAMVASVTQAPLTAITILFELTHNMSLLLPLVVASSVAVGVYNHFVSGSIYTTKLHRKGINLEWGRETGVLENIPVERVYVPEDETFRADMDLPSMLEHFSLSSRSTIPVTRAGKLLGLISFWDLRELLKDQNSDLKTAEELMRVKMLLVTPKENLYTAFSKISLGDYEYLPVVDSEESMMLLGRLSRQRILQTYKNQLTLKGILDHEDS